MGSICSLPSCGKRATGFSLVGELPPARRRYSPFDISNELEENICMRTFEYRLFVNKQQAHLLMECLKETRIIFNEMLESVKAQYEEKGTFPSKYNLETAFKGQGAHVPATTVQMLADRLSQSLKQFLTARQHTIPGVGFPRFKKPNRWHSIQLRQYGKDVSLHEDKKHLIVPKKIGHFLKIKLHRPMEGTPKTVHLVLRADGHWYALIVCETEARTDHLESICEHPDVGIDVGLTSFLTDSEGHTVENPRFYRTSQKTLRRKQRQLCRRKKGSHRRRKAARNTAQTHLKIARQRRDFHFKVAKRYTESHQHIAVEDLGICNMVKNHHLAQSIMDASWGAFLNILEDKAARAGHQVIRVDPRFTSQKCHQCGEIVQKSLSVRTHICPFCGYVADRDVNAAKNILLKARAWPSGTVSAGSPVELRSPQL
jgi:putative transposase